MHYATTLLAMTMVLGCTAVPDVAPEKPWFEPETTDLERKAEEWETASIGMLNSQGLLLYTGYDPDGWGPSGKGWEDYVDSHNVADAPAWHGRLMAALAFAWAVDGRDRNDTLLRLANGLHTYYDITGIEGLFGRSYLADYTGERRPWMETQEEAPTKWWKQEEDGRWWRMGLAKNHFLGAVVGCGVPLVLDHSGRIHLRDDVRERLLAVALPAVRRFVANDFQIIDYDGERTDFGDLRPALVPKEWMEALQPFVGIFGLSEEDVSALEAPLNGFNAMLVLAIMSSVKDYDADIATKFASVVGKWMSGASTSFRVLGFAVKKIGHWNIGKPSYSDMAAVGFATAALMLHDMDASVVADAQTGLRGLWGYMRWERNPMFTFPYHYLVDGRVDLSAVEADLRAFPSPARKIAHTSVRDDTDEVQPLCNRITNSYYWKSSPFRRALPPHDPALHPTRGSKFHYAGADYLIAYWLGRFYGAIPRR